MGVSHIADFLKEKGFEVDAKPTTKLTEEMYDLLIKEYSKDKVLKEKADQVNIGGARQKPEEEAETTKEAPEKEAAPEKEEEKTEEEEVIRAKKEKVSTPKVVGKIDVSDTKKKKPAKKEEKTEEVKPAAEKKEEAPAVKEEKKEEVKEVKEVKKEKEKVEPEMIETQKVTLSGPKILGKVEIKEKEKKPSSDAQDKKKRKRIRKPERINVDRVREQQNRDNRRGDRNKQPLDPEEQQRLIQEQVRSTLAKLGASKGGSKEIKKTKSNNNLQ